MKKQIRHILFYSLCMLIWLVPMTHVMGSEVTISTIRVGIALQEGFAQVDEHNETYGYMFAYLEEISKYNGWKYEYVFREGENAEVELKELLKQGDIDILTGIHKEAENEQQFAFPEYAIGYSYTNIIIPQENHDYSESDKLSLQGMKLAYNQNQGHHDENLYCYCETKGLDMSVAFFANTKESFQALENGEVDGVLSGDFVANEQYRVVTKFAKEPIYIVTNKTSNELMDKLNAALMRIHDIDPSYDDNLYATYFPMSEKNIFVLSEREKDYIATLEPLEVVSGLNAVPLDYFEGNQYKGIAADTFKRISELTGLQFNYTQVHNQQMALDKIENGTADITTGIYEGTQVEQHTSLIYSASYAQMPVVMIHKASLDVSNLETASEAKATGYDNDEWPLSKYYDTIEDCIIAVEDGEVDYTYANVYLADYYTRNYEYTDLILSPATKKDHRIVFGIGQPVDSELVTILNKTIQHIDEEERAQILFQNTSKLTYNVSLKGFIILHPVASIVSLLIVLVLIIIGIHFKYRRKRRIDLQFLQRYRMLAELNKEMIVEYNCVEDTLILSEKDADFFGLTPITVNFLKGMNNQEFYFSKDKICALTKEELYGDETTFQKEVRMENVKGEILWFRATILVSRDEFHKPLFCLAKLHVMSRQ